MKNKNMKVSIQMDYNMVKVYGHQRKVKGMKDNGKSKRGMGLANGLMVKENHMRDIGN
jgi:hypothetical protein